MECYEMPDGQRRRVIQNATMDVAQGECTAIIGTEPFEMQVLLEIVGNIKPYESGRCKLVGLGMMQRKRVILSHVNYVNEQKLVCDHLQGLSWLMFSSRYRIKSDRERQIYWLERLMELHLCELCFQHVRDMTPTQRMFMSLLLSLETDAVLVLADFSHVTVPSEYFGCAEKLFNQFIQRGKTVLFATAQCELAQCTATHAAFLVDGVIYAHDEVGAISDKYDHRLFILQTDQQQAASMAISTHYPGIRCESGVGGVSLYGLESPRMHEVLRALDEQGASYSGIIASTKSLSEALKGLMLELNSQDAPPAGKEGAADAL